MSKQGPSARSRRFAIAAIGLLLAAIAGAATLRLAFPVDEVVVEGTSRLAPEALEAAGLRRGTPLVSVDESAIEERLQKMAWVEQVAVTVDWPGGVRVAVAERRSVGQVVTADGQWAQIGAGGVLIDLVASPGATPALLGVTAPARLGDRVDPAADTLVGVASALPSSLQPHVVQMRMDPDGIRLGLRQGVVVVLGDERDLAAKLTAAAAVVGQVDPTELDILDVRSPSRPVSTLRGSTANLRMP